MDLGGNGVTSPYGISDFTKGGSDSWGAGIPSPTIDCAAVGTSSSASLQCSGATPTFAGTGQTAAGSPWWYRYDTAVRPSIALNGSTDYWNLGNQSACGEKQVVLIEFAPTTVSGAEYLVSIDDRSSKRDFGIYRNGSGVVPTWFRSGGGSFTELPVSGLVAGSAFVFATSYDATGGNGAGVLRANLNGVAATPVTTGVAPLQNLTDQPLGIGAAIGASPLLSSSKIRRVARWCGPDAPISAAQLAQLVSTQWGLAADKPSGTVATHARNDSTLCCPFTDAECFTVGPGAPCIHAPSYSGWAGTGGGIEVFGPGANGLTYSEAFENAAWVKDASVTVADNSAACPSLGPIRMALVTVGTANHGLYQYGASTAEKSRAVLLAAATGDADCTIKVADANGTGLETPALTQAPVRYFRYDASGDGLWMYRGGTCTRWCAQYAQTTNPAYPVPYRPTTGTAYAGSASTATTLTVPVALTDPTRWAISVTAWPTGGWQRANLWLAQWGPVNYGSASSTSLYVDGSYKLIGVAFDAGGAYRRLTSTATQSGSASRAVMLSYQSPTPAVYLDGAEVPGALDGASAGQAALPTATLTVGSSNAGNVNGLVSRLVQCKRAGGCR